jgi:glucuronokinase
MDFDPAVRREIQGLSCGVYEPLDPALLPPLYLAYDAKVAEPTEVLHNDLRTRYQRGEAAVVEAIKKFADLAFQGRNALLARDVDGLARAMNANFDLRRSICRLLPEHVAMIEAARRTGASAKYAGSGGAIVGLYRDEEMLARLRSELEPLGCRVLTLGL